MLHRAALLFCVLVPLAAASTCESLGSLTLANTTIAAESLAAYCKVTAVVRPVADSEIRVEIWLPPAAQWNGKFLGTGNGGYSGALSYAEMRAALARGYATAGSNTGHDGGDLKFGAGHPEKIRDWAYRAVHVMTETARQAIHAYYERAAAHAYFEGCSTGGHQALMEAQRYPDDYDGIVAGDPGNNRIRLNAGFLWSWLAAKDFPAAKLPMLNRAVVEACDAADGIKDGLIADPRRCRFDPGSLACKSGDSVSCLNEAEVAAVRKVYDGARVFPGWARGSELGWSAYFVGQPEPARSDFWRRWVFDNLEWNPHTFDFDRDVAAADRQVGYIDANNPDLSAFRNRKGKLLMYHGWADPVVPPEDGIGYYESVARAMGGESKIAPFFRLFMAPGMGHCGGGPGPNDFDMLAALDIWVTEGAAPERIVASHSTAGKVDRTRPLCPYPQVARWNGTGSTDDAANFTCGPER
ncbi:MAG TPA: tannase/feruloyl esterase family alpha/beta hydrolase [Bryobacteraceae bacterium]|nr:tannase/feruloyl esterase family alpha/beta hydrolase [Bryobacteraceae bacterium]